MQLQELQLKQSKVRPLWTKNNKKPQMCLSSFGGRCLFGLCELTQVSCRIPMRMMNLKEYFHFLFMIQKKN